MRRRRSTGASRALVFAMLLTSVACLASTQSALGQTLTHWWQANGSTVDSITNKSGALVGGTAYTSGNWGGEAFAFNGTNSAVELESKNGSGGHLLGTSFKSPFTIAMWVNLASAPVGTEYVLAEFTYGTKTHNNQATFWLENGVCSSGGALLSFRGYEQWSVPIDLGSLVGSWNLLTAEYHGGKANSASSYSLYLNGIQLTGTPVDCGTEGGSAQNDNTLGWDHHGYFWYDGLMDDIQIYNSALSNEQVLSLVTNETL